MVIRLRKLVPRGAGAALGGKAGPVLAAVLCLALAGCGGPRGAVAPATAAAPPLRFENYCVPIDAGLAELSGLTMIGARLYAIGDSGSDDRIAELGARCEVLRWIVNPVDPYDVEDLAHFGNQLWLGDIGDNRARRGHIALTRTDPATGRGALHRLSYPDGAHDAEAMLIEPGGRPIIVTKRLLSPAGVYVPAAGEVLGALPSPGPALLERAGQVNTGGEEVTGGAVSADGRAAALRTYSALYLFPVRDGDVVAALTRASPVRVALPAQPQGEAVAFTAAGDVLIGTERVGSGPLPPIQILRGAVTLVTGK